MKKNTAHNLLEVKTLIKEAFMQGRELVFDDTKWHKHDSDELICTSRIELAEFILDLKDHSLTIEVL